MFGFHPHQLEEMDFANSRADRFAGFDRGDTGLGRDEFDDQVGAEAEADYQAFLAAQGE